MIHPPNLEQRHETDFIAELRSRLTGYLPDWQPGERGVDAALLAIAARYASVIGKRLNQVPAKNLLAFLETAGIERIPAQSARAPIVFKTNPLQADGRIPQRTRVAAAPPPGSNDQIIFETETDIGLAAAQLLDVVTVHPGRDQFAAHSQAHQAGTPFTIFTELKNTEHTFYLGHQSVLNLAGDVIVKVSFELAAHSSERLDIRWEYWDGKVWRPFASVLEQCEEEAAEDLDGTNGLTRSGAITLMAGCAETKALAVNEIETFWIRGRLLEPLPVDPTQVLPLAESVKLQSVIKRPLLCASNNGSAEPECLHHIDAPVEELKVKTGLLPDKAFADATPLDLTKSFYPLTQQPQPGSVFYFTSEELFSKPNARAQVLLKTAATPEDDLNVNSKSSLTHKIVWEYWNGTDWIAFSPKALATTAGATDPADDFTADSVLGFTVPADMVPITINDEEARWMRVRLVSGGYGFKNTVSWVDESAPAETQPNTFTYVIPQPPALAHFRLGYTWESVKEAPEATLAYNDFRFEDFTVQARYPGRTFLPFSRMNDTTPGFYLGFDKKLPVDFVNLFFDIVEEAGDEEGPALVWEYWDGGSWRFTAVQDETGNLSRPGMVSLVGAVDAAPLTRFGESRHWLRARRQEDGPPPHNTFNAIHLNAVWASQRQTLRDETVGQSSGLPNQFFQMRQFPVLAGETIEVRELSGALADIEYPILRDELGEERLRTVTSREGKVTEVWVRWQGQAHLFFSGAEDRHYALNRADGRLIFGDGVNGKIPPANAVIMAREYRAGGGTSGNVPQGMINQPLGGVPVQELFNALPAEGGADAEPIDLIAERGPRTLRHRGRAMTTRDYAVMAREASPAVAWVRVFAASDPYLGRRPGHVLVMILPETKERRPWPSYGLRQQVRNYFEARATASLCAARCIHVTGPNYFPIDVEVTIVPQNAAEAGLIEQRVRAALEEFLHPLYGGPRRSGWELGRDVFLSDIAAEIEAVAGVDYAREITLLRDNAPQGNRIAVPRDRLVVAGNIHIKLLLSERK